MCILLEIRDSLAHQNLVFSQADLSTIKWDVEASVASLELSWGLGASVHSAGHVQLLALGGRADFDGAQRNSA